MLGENWRGHISEVDYARAFVEYVDEHPETQSEYAFFVASKAFQSKFSCQ